MQSLPPTSMRAEHSDINHHSLQRTRKVHNQIESSFLPSAVRAAFVKLRARLLNIHKSSNAHQLMFQGQNQCPMCPEACRPSPAQEQWSPAPPMTAAQFVGGATVATPFVLAGETVHMRTANSWISVPHEDTCCVIVASLSKEQLR